MRKFGCALMILPVLAFAFFMVKFNDVGPVEGTTMWIVFFIGLWIANQGTKEDESKGRHEVKSHEPVNTTDKVPIKKYNTTRKTTENKVQEPISEYLSHIEKEPKLKPEIEVLAPKSKQKEDLPQAKEETEKVINNIQKVNYTSSRAKQTNAYPIFRYPKKNTVVRSYRIGTTKRRGYKEEVFQKAIETAFGSHFIVSGEIRINTGKDTRPFEPDIALVDRKNNSLRIDIEIDEPYAGITRQPTHCKGDNTMRDIYFIDRGWIVIRFSEYQVHKFEKQCLKFISDVINSVSPTFCVPEKLANTQTVENEMLWDIVQAQKWEKDKYREKYLEHEFMYVADRIETIDREFNEQEINEENLVQPTLIGIADKRPSIGFNLINAHPRDKRIEFYPEPHIYTIDKTPAPSASTVISKFFPEFDSPYWSRKKAIERLTIEGLELTESNIQRVANQIAKGWKDKGEKAAQEGTYLHEQIEKFYLNQDYQRTDEFSLFEQFVSDHEDIKPYRSEWRVFDEDHHIAGTIDLISKNGSGYEIYDWKRSKKVVNPITGEPICDNSWQCGVGQLSEIDDTSYNRYCLQQSLYRYILEKNYGLTVTIMNLVVLYPDYDRYYKVEVPYQRDKAEYILRTL
ncbi:MAG: hypothetical protein K9H64_10410 [Bacteroidales bacterium]|nr:hypothetical protein [Bacteroidales bacterium]MCF8456280.1 hypothetical protein [Bacteroidales bacterium]